MSLIGGRIKLQRQKLNMTQVQLSEKLNVTSQVVSNWERGYTNPDSTDILNLSNMLNVTSDYLLTGGDSKQLSNDMQEWNDFGTRLIEEGYSLSDIQKSIENLISALKS